MFLPSCVIYSEHQSKFYADVLTNRTVGKMVEHANQLGLHPGKSEINSWRNNVSHIKDLIELSKIHDTYVTFEYILPYSRKRIDCVLYGMDDAEQKNVIHIELKQWTNDGVSCSGSDGNFETAEDDPQYLVEAFTGGAIRTVPHPSQQVKGYHGYLSNFVDVISTGEVSLSGCAYCYFYYRNNSGAKYLFDSKYDNLLQDYPTYAADDVEVLASRLQKMLGKGKGLTVFNKVINSKIRPSKKLLEETSQMIENADTSAFSLLDEQIVARNIIRDKIKRLKTARNKSVIIVKGGPGTGKTVIALHLIAELAQKGLNIHYATKSKPLLEGVRSQLRTDSRPLFSNVGSFVPASAAENSIDVLFIDEAHRIQKSANTQYTKSYQRTDLPQIDTLVRAAKVSVFFIDDRQAIRGVEIGSSELVRQCAARWGAQVEEVELYSQFRCNGSDGYLSWLEQVLYGKEVTASFDPSEFDFRLFDDPQAMYDRICEKNSLPGQTARMCAGFCWPWTNHLLDDGTLAKDVQIGSFAMPWETHGNITRPPKGYVHWYQWAYRPEGIKQIGCIYTAQGFEFDYIGVIIGEDLCFDPVNREIYTDKNPVHDPVLRRNVSEATMTFDDYVRNIYRVLMSRGMKGCYVYCCNQALADYLQESLSAMKQKLEALAASVVEIETPAAAPVVASPAAAVEPVIVKMEEERQSRIYDEEAAGRLPFYSIKAACGYFEDYGNLPPDEADGWVDVSDYIYKPKPGDMFVVQACGDSMSPMINDGDYVVFEKYTGGSRNGNIVLTEMDGMDMDNDCHFTIKKYRSEKAYDEDGSWQHTKVELIPINPAFQTIELEDDPFTTYRTVGVLKCVIPGE